MQYSQSSQELGNIKYINISLASCYAHNSQMNDDKTGNCTKSPSTKYLQNKKQVFTIIVPVSPQIKWRLGFIIVLTLFIDLTVGALTIYA